MRTGGASSEYPNSKTRSREPVADVPVFAFEAVCSECAEIAGVTSLAPWRISEPIPDQRARIRAQTPGALRDLHEERAWGGRRPAGADTQQALEFLSTDLGPGAELTMREWPCAAFEARSGSTTAPARAVQQPPRLLSPLQLRMPKAKVPKATKEVGVRATGPGVETCRIGEPGWIPARAVSSREPGSSGAATPGTAGRPAEGPAGGLDAGEGAMEEKGTAEYERAQQVRELGCFSSQRRRTSWQRRLRIGTTCASWLGERGICSAGTLGSRWGTDIWGGGHRTAYWARPSRPVMSRMLRDSASMAHRVQVHSISDVSLRVAILVSFFRFSRKDNLVEGKAEACDSRAGLVREDAPHPRTAKRSIWILPRPCKMAQRGERRHVVLAPAPGGGAQAAHEQHGGQEEGLGPVCGGGAALKLGIHTVYAERDAEGLAQRLLRALLRT
ncbi:hypothetical protein CYMTET_56023 [Cymbomonas tetramitiformis]|uniref:Uncharacterized protein n=1 Tax=Cymbomonas tetramitiformis TaxID=36881 RepID=A0AAE0BD08_9CHLO|nr:hypothetical protein CYMTET_56023 [Cymbomonas tetramitiformis]